MADILLPRLGEVRPCEIKQNGQGVLDHNTFANIGGGGGGHCGAAVVALRLPSGSLSICRRQVSRGGRRRGRLGEIERRRASSAIFHPVFVLGASCLAIFSSSQHDFLS